MGARPANRVSSAVHLQGRRPDVRRNWDRVSDGFGILHPVLVKFVVRELVAAYGKDSWWSKGVEPVLKPEERQNFRNCNSDYDRIVKIDILLALRIIDIGANWNQVFRDNHTQDFRTYALELKGVRNKFAHRGLDDCTINDAYRWLDSMHRLCEEADPDPDQKAAGEIQSLMDEALPDLIADFEKRKASAATAAMSVDAAAMLSGEEEKTAAGEPASPAAKAEVPAAKEAPAAETSTSGSSSEAAPKTDKPASRTAAANPAATPAKAAGPAPQTASATKAAAPPSRATAPTSTKRASPKRATPPNAVQSKVTSATAAAPAKRAASSKTVQAEPSQGSAAKAATSTKGATSTKPASSNSASKSASTPATADKTLEFAEYKSADVNHNYSSSAEPNVEFVRDVLSIEAPMHRDVVIKRMGQRMRRNVADRVVKHDANVALNKVLADSKNYSCGEDGFITCVRTQGDSNPPRKAGDRTWEEIPPEELEAGLLLVLANEQSSGSQGLSLTKLINRTFSEFMPDAENAQATGEAYEVLAAAVDNLGRTGKVNIADDSSRTVSLSAQEKQAAGKSRAAAASTTRRSTAAENKSTTTTRRRTPTANELADASGKSAAATNKTTRAASEEKRASSAAKSSGSATNNDGMQAGLPSSLDCHAEKSSVGVKAQGTFHYPECTLDVLPGSQIDLRKTPNSRNVNELRQELIESGVLEKQSDGIYVLKQTITFDTPSAAGVFVFGSSGGGWRKWKDPDGRSLDEIYPKEGRPSSSGNFKVSATPQASDESSQIAERSKGARASGAARTTRTSGTEASTSRTKKTQPASTARGRGTSASAAPAASKTEKVQSSTANRANKPGTSSTNQDKKIKPTVSTKSTAADESSGSNPPSASAASGVKKVRITVPSKTNKSAAPSTGRVEKTQAAGTTRSVGTGDSSAAGKDATVKVYAYIPGCDKRATAVFHRSNGQTDVPEGSFVRIAAFDSLPHHIKDRREKLLASGDLVAQDGQLYVLKRQVSFDSATAAAEFVLGRSASGATDWKDAQSGKKLGEAYPELFHRRRGSGA